MVWFLFILVFVSKCKYIFLGRAIKQSLTSELISIFLIEFGQIHIEANSVLHAHKNLKHMWLKPFLCTSNIFHVVEIDSVSMQNQWEKHSRRTCIVFSKFSRSKTQIASNTNVFLMNPNCILSSHRLAKSIYIINHKRNKREENKY